MNVRGDFLGPPHGTTTRAIGRPLSSVCMLSTVYISSPHKPLGQLKPNFTWSLHVMGERKFVQTVLVTWPRWPQCPYMVKTLKNLFLGNKRSIILKLDMQHGAARVLPSLLKWWPWVDLDQLTSKLCPLGAVCSLHRGYIHVLNHEKICIKTYFTELATNR